MRVLAGAHQTKAADRPEKSPLKKSVEHHSLANHDRKAVCRGMCINRRKEGKTACKTAYSFDPSEERFVSY
jgi:hypothetical protein